MSPLPGRSARSSSQPSRERSRIDPHTIRDICAARSNVRVGCIPVRSRYPGRRSLGSLAIPKKSSRGLRTWITPWADLGGCDPPARRSDMSHKVFRHNDRAVDCGRGEGHEGGYPHRPYRRRDRRQRQCTLSLNVRLLPNGSSGRCRWRTSRRWRLGTRRPHAPIVADQHHIGPVGVDRPVRRRQSGEVAEKRCPHQ
jgi:hypothetical protein